MLLALDDTDSPTGGCTTHALFAVLQALPGLAPKGLPRLVRLNPNVPWKTRGNGAVCVELVRPAGPSVRIGEWRGLEIHASPHGMPASPADVDLDAVWNVVSALAQPDASPAVAVFSEAPPEAHYWQAVRGVVDPRDAAAAVLPGSWRSVAGNRGLVGCVAAAAWRGPAASQEFIAYREPGNVGTERRIDEAPLLDLDAKGATFHTHDPESNRLACVPGTPCPVLIGLRGRNPDLLVSAATRALAVAAREPVDAWLLWDSNQASGDHIVPVPSVLEAEPYSTLEVEGTVAGPARSNEGGHVHVPLTDSMDVPFEAIAFEPTHGFRDHVRDLREGDRVRVVGAWNQRAIHLEQIAVELAVPSKVSNPVHCGKSMKSRGRDAGYRCACGHTEPATAATLMERPTGRFEVPVMARRHLHRPLSWDDAGASRF